MSQLVNAKEAQWDEEIFIAFIHMKENHFIILSHFMQKTEINPTIMRRRCLSVVIYSVHRHISVLLGKVP